MSTQLAHVAFLVRDYDPAIAWFTGALGFSLIEDTDLGGGKRWVRVQPPGGGVALLLARAVDEPQRAVVGRQGGGRVAWFLQTDDFSRDHAAMQARGVRFVEAPRRESYGTVAVFEDLHGGRWDLIGPPGLGCPMAVFWNLGLVARSRAQAEACVAYFQRQKLVEQGREVVLQVAWQATQGVGYPLRVGEEIDEDAPPAEERAEFARARDAGTWLVSVWPRGMNWGSPEGSASGLTAEDSRVRIAAAFDGWLREAPAFQAAFFGSEAFDFFFAGGLRTLTAAGIDGLFVDEDTWNSLGQPEAAQPAGPGRRSWTRTLVP